MVSFKEKGNSKEKKTKNMATKKEKKAKEPKAKKPKVDKTNPNWKLKPNLSVAVWEKVNFILPTE